MRRLRAAEHTGPILIRSLDKGDDNLIPYWQYRVAETDILADLDLSDLRPFATVERGAGRQAWPESASPGEIPGDLGYRCRAHGPIGRGVSEIELEVGPESLDLMIDGSALYAVSRDQIVAHGSGLGSFAVEQAVSGICLILALALRGVYILHASAVLHRGQAIAFAGDSGAGKSTLAAQAALPPLTGVFRRLTDDLLPFGPGDENAALVWPAFPQLKLGALDQSALVAQPEYRLRTLILLRPLDSGEQLAIHRLTPTAAAFAILAHTVAARLFPPVLLRRHLALAAKLAESLPVFTLDYPHGEGSPEQVYDLIGRLTL